MRSFVTIADIRAENLQSKEERNKHMWSINNAEYQ
jgi:hypothetical protein